MSVIPAIYSGLEGKKDVKVRIPGHSASSLNLANRNPQLGMVVGIKDPGQRTLNPTTGYDNTRGVMTCQPINITQLRTPAVNTMNSVQAPQGVGYKTAKGLQSMPEYPNNYPVLPPTSNFTA